MASGSSIESGLSAGSILPGLRIAPSLTQWATGLPWGAQSPAMLWAGPRSANLPIAKGAHLRSTRFDFAVLPLDPPSQRAKHAALAALKQASRPEPTKFSFALGANPSREPPGDISSVQIEPIHRGRFAPDVALLAYEPWAGGVANGSRSAWRCCLPAHPARRGPQMRNPCARAVRCRSDWAGLITTGVA